MAELKPYPAYKDSGVEWIGEIPEDWSVVKLKYLSMVNTGDKDTQDNVMNGLYPFFVRSDKVERINEYTHDEEAVMTAGDGVGVGKVFHYYEGKFSAHQRVYLFTNFNNITGKYLYYYLRSNLIFEVKQGTAKSTVDSLRRNMLTNLPISIPNVKQQKRIAEFIDDKASEIELLISDKKHLIELLEEKRQAIITETVTKGLDPNVKMKDSGIEWIGEVPEHWEIKKLRYLGFLQNGISKSGNDFGHGYPFISYSDVFNNLVLPTTAKNLVNSTDNERKLYSVKKGDVFFTRTSETADEIAYASTALQDIKAATFAGFLIRFRPKNNSVLHTDFIKYYVRSNLRERYFVKEMNLVTRASLSQGLLKDFPVIVPPIEEQELIGEYIDSELKNIGEITKLLMEQISKLKEYRESLIYEAVTGKIDLRDYEVASSSDVSYAQVAETKESYNNND